MTTLQDLLPASFNGVEFMIRNEVLPNEGRRIVLHEYPNSNERFVEDLGQLPSLFRLQAFVHGSDAAARRDALATALNAGGVGRLVLPSFGARDVYALPYSIETDQKNIGEFRFSLEFAVGRPAAGPSLAQRDLQEVYDLGDVARQAIENQLSSVWETPSDAANAAVAAYDLGQAIDGAINELPNNLTTELTGNVQRIQQSVERSSFSLVRSGQSLANTLIGTNISGQGSDGFWQSFSIGFSDILGPNPLGGDSIFSGLLSLMQFGSGLTLRLSDLSGDFVDTNAPVGTVALWPRDTAGRNERDNNRLRIVNTQRVNALIAGYEVIAARDYRTQDDISAARQSIEAEHDILMRDATEDETIIQSTPAVRTAVENVRLASLQVLEQKRNQTFDITTFNRGVAGSAFVEAYRLYGEDFTTSQALVDRTFEIRDLNPKQSAVAMVGEITALRAR